VWTRPGAANATEFPGSKKNLALVPFYDAIFAKMLYFRNSALNLLLLITIFLDKDTSIISQLLSLVPGILNFAFFGVNKNLKAQEKFEKNYFYETDENYVA
jgi:hypothetical protein